MKLATKLTNEQIIEINAYLNKMHVVWGRDPLDYTDALAAQFGAGVGENFPIKGDKYFAITNLGELYQGTWNDENYNHMEKAIGNIYRTKEGAEAKIELLKHIQKFEEPKHNKTYFSLGVEYWVEHPSYNENLWVHRCQFNSGTIMPFSSTLEDRKERQRLLQLYYS